MVNKRKKLYRFIVLNMISEKEYVTFRFVFGLVRRRLHSLEKIIDRIIFSNVVVRMMLFTIKSLLLGDHLRSWKRNQKRR